MEAFDAALFVTAPAAVVYAILRGRLPGQPAGVRLLVGCVLWLSFSSAVPALLSSAGILGGTVNRVSFLSVLIVAIAVGRPWPRPLSSRPKLRLREPDLALVIGLTATGALRLLRNFSTAPLDFDTLAYHLPAQVQWAQTGELSTLEWFGVQRGFALGLEIWGLPYVQSLQSVALSTAINAIACVALALAIHVTIRECGGSRTSAVTTAVVIAASPLVTKQLGTLQGDLALAACFLSGVALSVRGRRESDAPLTALALGAFLLMPFFKLSGWAYLVVALLWMMFAHGSDLRPRRRDLGWLAIPVALSLLWPLRNLLLEGNPLGEVEIAFGSWVWAAGSTTASGLSATTLLRCFDPGDTSHWQLLGTALRSQLGWAVLFLAAMVVSGNRWARRRESPPRLALWALLGMTLLFFVISPYSGDNGSHGFEYSLWSAGGLRYGIPFLSVLFVILATTVGNRLLTVALLRALAAIALVSMISRTIGSHEVLIVLVIASLAAALTLLRKSWARIDPAWLVAVLFVLVVAGTPPLTESARERDWRRSFGSTMVRLDELIAPGEALAFSGVERPFPLAGIDLGRKIAGLPVEGGSAELWRRDRGSWRAEASAWLGRLEREGPRHLVIREKSVAPEWDSTGAEMRLIVESRPGWRVVLEAKEPDWISLRSYDRGAATP
jgi:hypothetical protein